MPGGGLAMRSNVALTSADGQLRAVVELHALAQKERVGLAVLGDLPAMRQIGDDGLAAVARIAPDQVVEHAALRAQAVDGARLVHVEMRRPVGDAVAQHAAALRVGLRRRELEFRAVELHRDVGGQAVARGQAVSAGRRRRAALAEIRGGSTPDAWNPGSCIVVVLPFGLFMIDARCALMASSVPYVTKITRRNLRESSLESSTTGARRRARSGRAPAQPVLEIDDLQTHFFTAGRRRARGRRRLLCVRSRRDAGRGRRIRLRQKRHRAVHPAPGRQPAGPHRRRRHPLRGHQPARPAASARWSASAATTSR